MEGGGSRNYVAKCTSCETFSVGYRGRRFLAQIEELWHHFKVKVSRGARFPSLPGSANTNPGCHLEDLSDFPIVPRSTRYPSSPVGIWKLRRSLSKLYRLFLTDVSFHFIYQILRAPWGDITGEGLGHSE